MYSNKLAIALKVNGQVLREDGDSVRLPFGSEYSLLIKNLNTVKALVSIEIDGNDIADGTSFVIQPNSSIDIERFLKGGNKNSGNRFKFIERTARVEAGRGGIQVEDGLIRVQFEFEREAAPLVHHTPWMNQYGYIKGIHPSYYGGTFNDTIGQATSVSYNSNGGGSGSVASSDAFVGNVSAQSASGKMRGFVPSNYADKSVRLKSANEAGITAPGSVSNQQFVEGHIGLLDGVKHSMIMRLLGEVGEQKVQQPITVKSKQRCVTCKHLNKSNAKFCSECGTGLEIVA